MDVHNEIYKDSYQNTPEVVYQSINFLLCLPCWSYNTC